MGQRAACCPVDLWRGPGPEDETAAVVIAARVVAESRVVGRLVDDCPEAFHKPAASFAGPVQEDCSADRDADRYSMDLESREEVEGRDVVDAEDDQEVVRTRFAVDSSRRVGQRAEAQEEELCSDGIGPLRPCFRQREGPS